MTPRRKDRILHTIIKDCLFQNYGNVYNSLSGNNTWINCFTGNSNKERHYSSKIEKATCNASSSSAVRPVEQSGREKQNTILSVEMQRKIHLSTIKYQSSFWQVWLTCFSLKERLPFVLTFWLCLIIMKFFVFLFSLLLVLACGFNLVFFLTNSFRSVRPA